MFKNCIKFTNKVLHFSSDDENNDIENLNTNNVYKLKIDEYISSHEFLHNSYLFVTIYKNGFTIWCDNIKIDINKNMKKKSYYNAITKCLERILQYDVDELVIHTLSNYILDIFINILDDKDKSEYCKKLKNLIKQLKKISYN